MCCRSSCPHSHTSPLAPSRPPPPLRLVHTSPLCHLVRGAGPQLIAKVVVIEGDLVSTGWSTAAEVADEEGELTPSGCGKSAEERPASSSCCGAGDEGGSRLSACLGSSPHGSLLATGVNRH